MYISIMVGYIQSGSLIMNPLGTKKLFILSRLHNKRTPPNTNPM